MNTPDPKGPGLFENDEIILEKLEAVLKPKKFNDIVIMSMAKALESLTKKDPSLRMASLTIKKGFEKIVSSLSLNDGRGKR